MPKFRRVILHMILLFYRTWHTAGWCIQQIWNLQGWDGIWWDRICWESWPQKASWLMCISLIHRHFLPFLLWFCSQMWALYSQPVWTNRHHHHKHILRSTRQALWQSYWTWHLIETIPSVWLKDCLGVVKAVKHASRWVLLQPHWLKWWTLWSIDCSLKSLDD